MNDVRLMDIVLVQNWWVVALRGAIAILFGVLTFLMPGITLAALVLLFGVYALVDGLFAIIAAARRRSDRPWWMLLLQGLTGIAAGIITIFWPGITALFLLYLIAVWAIMIGVFEIGAAIRLRKVITGEWLLALAGIAAIVFGGLLIASPGAGALAVVIWIGAYAIVTGVLLLILGFRLRSWGRGSTPGHMTPHPA